NDNTINCRVECLHATDDLGEASAVKRVEVESIGMDFAVRYGLRVEGGPVFGVNVGDALSAEFCQAFRQEKRGEGLAGACGAVKPGFDCGLFGLCFAKTCHCFILSVYCCRSKSFPTPPSLCARPETNHT